MNNPYCKHGTHHAIRCFSCESDKRDSTRGLKSLFEEDKEITESARREQAKKRIYEAAKRLDW